MAPAAAADDAIAVRLADEGVPLRAIARAIQVPSDTLRDQLAQALDDGRLLELPHNDWPPGFPRDQRALQLSRLIAADRETLARAVRALFRLTVTETALLLALLQTPAIGRGGTLRSVHIHHLRARLRPFGLAIATLWGDGYQLADGDRRKAMDLILARVEGA